MIPNNASRKYPIEPVINKGELPDPFAIPGVGRVATSEEWPAQAQMWKDMILKMEYGGLPPQPEGIEVEILSRADNGRWPGKPNFWSYRVHCLGGAKPFSFCVQILFPKTPRPFPAIVTGDGCWWYLTDDIARRVLESGCALVMFNRTEIVEDMDIGPEKMKRSGGLYEVYPDRQFGALSAWAWGYHRCVDMLQELPFIDTKHIAITGHSRGGKVTLVAGATDERIALVNDNASCAGGSTAFRYVGHDGETLNIINMFPSWFGSGLHPYLGREEEIPFDQHCLLASIAPRLLLLTYTQDDRWSNPEGMVLCARAAREVYRFLEMPDNIAFHLREGAHSHAPEDWGVLLDFIDWKWKGLKPKANYNIHPYKHLQLDFSWKAPIA